MADVTKARSRKRWRDLGYHVENGECVSSYSKSDLFGFADLVAVPLEEADLIETVTPAGIISPLADPWIYIQSTSWAKVPTRLRKIQEEEFGKGQWARPIRRLARLILERGDLIVIEGWRKDKSGRYELRERWLTLEDL